MNLSPHFVAATTDYADYNHPVPAPALRRVVELPAVKSVTLTVCGLGYYEFFLNGIRMTRGLLSPYTANSDHICPYDHYDLTGAVRVGENVLGFLLGNGMQNCFGGRIWDLDKLSGRSAPKLALYFEAVCADGTVVAFDARDGFLCTESGIRMDDLRAGEWFDARVLPNDWYAPTYDPAAHPETVWRAPIPAETPKGTPRLCDIDPIVPTRELSPVCIRPGRIGRMSDIDASLPVYPIPREEQVGYIYDFGVNAAGLCRLCIRDTRPGQRITLTFGEKLTDEGELDLWSMFYAPQAYSQRDVYICRGGTEETYTPAFTYHGFRYCLVTGVHPEQITDGLLTYVVMNTDLSTRATFFCSDEMANRLWEAALVSDLSNFYHFPTDCPQREKNGWTGDASLSAEQMLTVLTPERNLREWMHHVRATMREDGSLPGIVPTGTWGWGHGPAWDNVLVNVPYCIWLYRGDTDVLRENAVAIARHMNYMRGRRDARGLADYGLGDWCPAGEQTVRTPNVVTATLTVLDYSRKAATVFDVLGMADEMAEATRLGDELYAAARRHLVDTDTCAVYGDTITAQALGLYHGLFEADEVDRAMMHLTELIDAAGGTFAGCGILGLRVLFRVLADNGQADLAYRLITQERFPSYGYMIAHGATSLWETFHRIEGNSPSLNHHFFGDILSWFVRYAVGIRVNPYGRDPNEIQLSPCFAASLTHVRGSYDAPAGRVMLAWERRAEGIRVTYRIPEGVRALWDRGNGHGIRKLTGDGVLWLDA